MKAFTDAVGGTPPQIVAHPIAFGSGEWTCVVGESADGSRMVTVAKWRDGAIAEEVHLDLGALARHRSQPWNPRSAGGSGAPRGRMDRVRRRPQEKETS